MRPRFRAWFVMAAMLGACGACGGRPTSAAAATAALPRAPELRRELLALEAEDQAARNAWIENPSDAARAAKVAEIDVRSTRAIKELIAKHGWPGKSLVGKDGAAAAWLLVQHADRDHPFQVEVLALLKPLVDAGEVEARHYAYLYDRVAVAEQRKQRYGTQFRDNEPAPIEDEAHVDERRKAVGLSSLAEYKRQLLEIDGPAK